MSERELGWQRGGRGGHLCLRGEEADKVAHTDVDPCGMEKPVGSFMEPTGPASVRR
jgi:hypothetical protein